MNDEEDRELERSWKDKREAAFTKKVQELFQRLLLSHAKRMNPDDPEEFIMDCRSIMGFNVQEDILMALIEQVVKDYERQTEEGSIYSAYEHYDSDWWMKEET